MLVFNLLLFFILSFGFCFYFMPFLLRLANKYSIYDTPNEIKRHQQKVTFLGGAAIVFGFYFPIVLFGQEFLYEVSYGSSLLFGLFVMFLYGLGDDLLCFKPWKRLLLQIIISAIFLEKCKFHINFETLIPGLGIIQPIGFVIEVLLFTGILNSFNLLDGSDGVVGTISFVNALICSFIFFESSQWFLCQISICLSGVLFAFLFYNKPPAYVFMGDAGSLFLGMFFAFLVFYLNSKIGSAASLANHTNRVVAFSFVALPVLDMLRLVISRLRHRKHPFIGDNNHIHHLLAKYGLRKTEIIAALIAFHVVLILVAFMVKTLSIFIFGALSIVLYVILIQALKVLSKELNRSRMRPFKERKPLGNRASNSSVNLQAKYKNNIPV